MYILRITTEEYDTKKPILVARFKMFVNMILRDHTCIKEMKLIDNETGEIIDEYKRL